MPADQTEWLNAVGGIIAGATIIFGMWLKSYLGGRAEVGEDLHGKHVILEQAELAALGTLPVQLAAIGPKLDQVFGQDATRREAIERVGSSLQRSVEAHAERLKEINAKIEEAVRILHRMESELELAKRMREEELLRVRRREDGRREDGP